MKTALAVDHRLKHPKYIKIRHFTSKYVTCRIKFGWNTWKTFSTHFSVQAHLSSFLVVIPLQVVSIPKIYIYMRYPQHIVIHQAIYGTTRAKSFADSKKSKDFVKVET